MPDPPQLSDCLTLNLSGLKCDSGQRDDEFSSATDISMQTTNPDSGEALSSRPGFVSSSEEASSSTRAQTHTNITERADAGDPPLSSPSPVHSQQTSSEDQAGESRPPESPEIPSSQNAAGDVTITPPDAGYGVGLKTDTAHTDSTESLGLSILDSRAGSITTSPSLVPSPDPQETTFSPAETVPTADDCTESCENEKRRNSLASSPRKFSQAESPRTDLLARPVESLVAEILGLRAQVQKYEKKVADQQEKLVRAETSLEEAKMNLQQMQIAASKDVSILPAGVQEEIDRLKLQLRIASSTSDYLQKALRDRSNREMEMRNHIAVLTAVNLDLQRQAKALTQFQETLKKNQTQMMKLEEIETDRQPEETQGLVINDHCQGGGGISHQQSSMHDLSVREAPHQHNVEGGSWMPPAEGNEPQQPHLRRSSLSSSAGCPRFSQPASQVGGGGGAGGDRKVQFDVCPVFGNMRYEAIPSCPIDSALAAFVNQRVNKILFTRVRPGVYLYGRMPVRVQLGTVPETQAKRLEVVAKGRRYTMANFIKLYEESEFLALDQAHKTGGTTMELSNLPGSQLDGQPTAYTSAGPGGGLSYPPNPSSLPSSIPMSQLGSGSLLSSKPLRVTNRSQVSKSASLRAHNAVETKTRERSYHESQGHMAREHLPVVSTLLNRQWENDPRGTSVYRPAHSGDEEDEVERAMKRDQSHYPLILSESQCGGVMMSEEAMERKTQTIPKKTVEGSIRHRTPTDSGQCDMESFALLQGGGASLEGQQGVLMCDGERNKKPFDASRVDGEDTDASSRARNRVTKYILQHRNLLEAIQDELRNMDKNTLSPEKGKSGGEGNQSVRRSRADSMVKAEKRSNTGKGGKKPTLGRSSMSCDSHALRRRSMTTPNGPTTESKLKGSSHSKNPPEETRRCTKAKPTAKKDSRETLVSKIPPSSSSSLSSTKHVVGNVGSGTRGRSSEGVPSGGVKQRKSRAPVKKEKTATSDPKKQRAPTRHAISDSLVLETERSLAHVGKSRDLCMASESIVPKGRLLSSEVPRRQQTPSGPQVAAPASQEERKCDGETGSLRVPPHAMEVAGLKLQFVPYVPPKVTKKFPPSSPVKELAPVAPRGVTADEGASALSSTLRSRIDIARSQMAEFTSPVMTHEQQTNDGRRISSGVDPSKSSILSGLRLGSRPDDVYPVNYAPNRPGFDAHPSCTIRQQAPLPSQFYQSELGSLPGKGDRQSAHLDRMMIREPTGARLMPKDCDAEDVANIGNFQRVSRSPETSDVSPILQGLPVQSAEAAWYYGNPQIVRQPSVESPGGVLLQKRLEMLQAEAALGPLGLPDFQRRVTDMEKGATCQ